MAVNYLAIGKNIRKIRTEKHWTQAKLAELSGIEPSNMSHIERAATKVSLPTLMNIAIALDVTLDELAYESLSESHHTESKMINSLISDCSPEELKALLKIIKTTKEILRNK